VRRHSTRRLCVAHPGRAENGPIPLCQKDVLRVREAEGHTGIARPLLLRLELLQQLKVAGHCGFYRPGNTGTSEERPAQPDAVHTTFFCVRGSPIITSPPLLEEPPVLVALLALADPVALAPVLLAREPHISTCAHTTHTHMTPVKSYAKT
jgi:hypothetical protein